MSDMWCDIARPPSWHLPGRRRCYQCPNKYVCDTVAGGGSIDNKSWQWRPVETEEWPAGEV